jgi:flavin-dependent dehydrogenase
MKDSYDCIVVGGGPAGSTAAALLAEARLSTLLLERETMPRFHVGESLMPETYWTLKRLGVLERMKNSQFVKKVSVQFINSSGKESQPFYFKEHDPHESSQTWQVERADFDKLLFDNAGEKGADCFDQTRVLDVLTDGPRAIGVKLETADGKTREVRSQVIVDATGQQALLANRLGLRDESPTLRKAAIWGYYRGARRDPGENGGATIIMHTQSANSWFWYIPLANDITSIGVVADNDYLLKGRGKPASVFEDELVDCPGLVERLMNAELASRFRIAKEFSYTTKQHAGEGWVLVGDAFGFIDPIYSSGVFFAMKSGELAADAIVEGFQSGDLSPAQLSKWADEFSGGVHLIRKLVEAYYTNEFSFGAFMRDFPQHRGNLTDLLIGRIFYDGAGRIFDDMDPLLEQARAMTSETEPVEARD